MRSKPAIVVLAAGRSSRMRGRDKLLELVDGEPLIRVAARAARAAAEEVLVVLPPASPRAAHLDGLDVRIVEAGMPTTTAASIADGIRRVRSDAAMLHLADMPEIGAAELTAMADAWVSSQADVLRAVTEDGRHGHPIVFARRHFAALLAGTGDGDASARLSRPVLELVPLPGRVAKLDLDTPEDWAAWRARSGR